MDRQDIRKEKERVFEALAEAERNQDMDAQADLMQQLIELNDRSKRGDDNENSQ